jgi:hypothetical protein
MGPVHRKIAAHLGFGDDDGGSYFEGYGHAMRAHHSRFLVGDQSWPGFAHRQIDINLHHNSHVALGHAVRFIQKHGGPREGHGPTQVTVIGHGDEYGSQKWQHAGTVDAVLEKLRHAQGVAAHSDPKKHIPHEG